MDKENANPNIQKPKKNFDKSRVAFGSKPKSGLLKSIESDRISRVVQTELCDASLSSLSQSYFSSPSSSSVSSCPLDYSFSSGDAFNYLHRGPHERYQFTKKRTSPSRLPSMICAEKEKTSSQCKGGTTGVEDFISDKKHVSASLKRSPTLRQIHANDETSMNRNAKSFSREITRPIASGKNEHKVLWSQDLNKWGNSL